MVIAKTASRQPVAAWNCRWCGSAHGSVVLDLGAQAPADHFPLPADPTPDPVHPLAMVMCAECSLAQLEVDPTTPDEPRGVEPAALLEQAEDAIRMIGQAGLLPAQGHLLEHPSPHGGSWVPRLTDLGLAPVADGPADVVVDAFGLMHESDQRSALQQRADELAPSGTLFVQFHSLAAIMRLGIWNALRHGHFAYYSTPVLVRMARSCGLEAVDAWQFDLYGGTVMLAFRRQGTPSARVERVVREEIDHGVLDPSRVADLEDSVLRSIQAIRAYVRDHRAAGLRIAGYGAASRSVALLSAAGLGTADIEGIADASPAKSGRCLPRLRIPVITPTDMVAGRPDRVLIFVPDMADEVRHQLPEVEAHGGRWVVLEPRPRELDPVSVSLG